jgi:serralysin
MPAVRNHESPLAKSWAQGSGGDGPFYAYSLAEVYRPAPEPGLVTLQVLARPTAAGNAAPIAAAPPPFNIAGITVVQSTGSDGNRVGIVFLGDGYTSGEISGTYHDHVEALTSYLFQGGILAEPFNRYRNFFNVYAVNLVSTQSGADDPANGTFVNTALNATYRGDGQTDRLLTIDWNLGENALSQALAGTSIHPHIKFVAVNSSTYGGSGGTFAVYAGGNGSALEVALHEMGHAFAFLADEYEAAGTGGAGGTTYSGPEPSSANVTTSASGAKWAQWLGYDQEGVGIIGAYEGAQYYSLGLYRPSLNSKMRTNNTPFDAIAREQFILQIYKLVDPIDHATPGTNLTDPVSLLVDVIDPAVIKVRWSVDDLVVSDANVENFVIGNYNVASGAHSIAALAYDPTDWVRLDRSSLEQRVSWTVTVTNATLYADGVHPLAGGPLSDTLIASRAADSLAGGDGVDTLSYMLSDAAVTVRLLTNFAAGGFAAGDGISGFENVTGSNFSDDLVGSAAVNVLDGGAGDDRLDGGAGADRLIGGSGNDVFFVDSSDTVIETVNAGLDEIRTALAAFTLGANLEYLTGTSATGQALTGNTLANRLTGAGGNDTLDGAGGADQLAGGLGNDVYVVGAGDTVTEAANAGTDEVRTALAAYALTANVENLTGTSASGQALTGNGLANVVTAGGGNDTLNGGAGADRLNGGLGNDLYVVDAGDLVVEAANGGTDEVRTALAAYALAANVEKLTGTGTTGQSLAGNGLANQVAGGQGNDILDGGAGADQLAGGLGNDVYVIDSSDTVTEAADAGVDEIRTALAAYALGGNVENLTGTSASGQVLSGNALANRLTGGAGNDRLDGGAGADRLAGGTGDDSYLIDGSDVVVEGVNEGTNDRIYTSVDYTLGAGVYVEILSTASDTGSAPLTLAGNELDNRVIGNAGANLLYGMGGTDRLEGLAGDDRYVVDRAGDLVIEAVGQGYDTLFSTVTYTLAAGTEVEAMSTMDRPGTQAIDFTGNEFDNDLYGNAGANRLVGGGGADFLDGGNGNDRLEGGAGSDIAAYWTAGAAVTVSLRLPGTAQNTGGAGSDTLIDIEGLMGSDFADTLIGNDLANHLDGRGGGDTMRGGGGDDDYIVDHAGDVVEENANSGIDRIWTSLAAYSLLGTNIENLGAASAVAHDFRGNAFANIISGGDGNDVLRLYDGGNDSAYGGAGDDTLFFIGSLTAADVVDGGAGSDTLVLQGPYNALTLTANVTSIENISILAGSNTGFGGLGTSRYDYVLTTNDANFAAGVQARINGAALLAGEDFTFNGSAETNASFVVYGGKGKDTLTGGLGNDIFFYAEERFASGDTVNGGSGYDGMFLRGNYAINFAAPGYTGLFTSIENLTLTSATDERYARGGGTEFDYNLTLSNAIVKPGETLTVSGAILMATETMILDGSQESDGLLRLFGGKAGDTLKGGGQADLIHGNLGADTLLGNGGADTFRYDMTAESNSASRDQILDFRPGTDKIDLSRIDAKTNLAGDQAFTWIGAAAFSGNVGQLRAFQQGGSWILEGDTNGDRVADLVIQLTLQGPTPLSQADFLL